jgi:5-carboxymethyl-2-hydroxymuconate isomerase
VGGFSVKKVKKKMEYVTSKGLGVHSAVEVFKSAVSSHLLSFNTHNSAMLNTYHHQHNIGLVLTQALDLSSLRSRRKLYKKWGVSKQSRPHVKVAATDELGSAAAAVKEEESQLGEDMFKTLDAAVSAKDAEGVKVALDKLRELGQTKLWSSIPNITRRNTFIRELTTMGIKNAEELAIPSVRNDAAFLGTVVGVTGFVAVVAGQLPGDWVSSYPILLVLFL